MKTIKNHRHACGFEFLLVDYGKVFKKKKYVIQLLFLWNKHVINIYKGDKKPIFKNLFIIGWLWSPISALISVFMAIFGILFEILYIIVSFYIFFCFQRKFITDPYEKVSGYIMFALSLVGLLYLISLIF
jgi:hypothetical protein